MQAICAAGGPKMSPVCVCNIHSHPLGGRIETYISLKVTVVMTSLSHHFHTGSSCIKADINNKASFVRPTKYFPALIKHKFLFFLTCTGKTEALFFREHMHSSRPNCLESNLKIEQSNESCSDVMSLFNSKRVFIWAIMSFRL